MVREVHADRRLYTLEGICDGHTRNIMEIEISRQII